MMNFLIDERGANGVVAVVSLLIFLNYLLSRLPAFVVAGLTDDFFPLTEVLATKYTPSSRKTMRVPTCLRVSGRCRSEEKEGIAGSQIKQVRIHPQLRKA
ncbi:hypothetical protein BDP55DRAFT_216000 [Colletotrichum godetiae]|uniref:Uncharacterized protein n=1 Tax=Colletotrichum godetiae TaxID=1209918 RepID=A0AAJ0F1W2_9PEZI|nr:uncharacterized protein BDP55DRAFT_216000 [Colletotrichum godetiae]KAK1700079.1 hypothetical protein BDP55DRAFT_216000 [Colletotrichum godetiae]